MLSNGLQSIHPKPLEQKSLLWACSQCPVRYFGQQGATVRGIESLISTFLSLTEMGRGEET
jgi:hypothetical protein